MKRFDTPLLEWLAARRPASPARTVVRPRSNEADRCELCSQSIAPTHRHLLDVDGHTLLCVCRSCSILYDRKGAVGGHFRLIPDRAFRIRGFRMDGWAGLEIPVDIAFFVRIGESGGIAAFYPGSAGATESLLPLDQWRDLESLNVVLRAMRPDVEALLISRLGEAGHAWLVPVDRCHELVVMIRRNWKGLAGGSSGRQRLEEFFSRLDRHAGVIEAHEAGWPLDR